MTTVLGACRLDDAGALSVDYNKHYRVVISSLCDFTIFLSLLLIFTARRYDSAVFAAVVSVCSSVHQKSEFYQNG